MKVRIIHRKGEPTTLSFNNTDSIEFDFENGEKLAVDYGNTPQGAISVRSSGTSSFLYVFPMSLGWIAVGVNDAKEPE